MGIPPKAAGLGLIGTHTMRHTYRSWLDAVGHKTFRATETHAALGYKNNINIYGDVVTDKMSSAARKVSGIAFSTNRAQSAHGAN
jgi:integrase